MKREKESLFARMLLATIPLSQRCGAKSRTKASQETIGRLNPSKALERRYADGNLGMAHDWHATDTRDLAIRKQVLEHNFLA